MKILIDPKLAVFVKDMTDAQCAELLRCIFEYPNRDCKLGLWQYMKAQIEQDEIKYREKCERAAIGRAVKLGLKSRIISTVKKEEIENKNKENEIKRSERRNASETVENDVESDVEKPREFFVDEFFSFGAIANKIPKFQKYLELFPLSVVTKAEQTFKKKRSQQWANMQHILDWLEKENVFYKRTQEAQ